MLIEITGFWGWTGFVIVVVFGITSAILWFVMPLVISQRLTEMVEANQETNSLLEQLNESVRRAAPDSAGSS